MVHEIYRVKSSWPKKNRRRGETNVGNFNSVETSTGRQSQKNSSGFSSISNTAPNNNQQHYSNRGTRGGGGARHRYDEFNIRSTGPSKTSGSGLDCAEVGFAPELNSVYLSGSKKHNLNHLLNFNYAPHPINNDVSRHGHSSVARRQYGKFNKEQFLQANCQFVVRSDIDLSPYVNKPDQLVEWTFVEQIYVKSTEDPQCPICLYHPVAAKMTRCGHVYCWPCVLHYLALSDKTWRKCPICYEAIHAADMKSAVVKSYINYNVGDYVKLQLMYRPKESLHVFKVSNSMEKKDSFPHLFGSDDEQMYCKLILADPNEILSIIERERNELKCQLSADGTECPESMFIQQALDLLQERQLNCEALAKKINKKHYFGSKQPEDVLVDKTTGGISKMCISAQVPKSFDATSIKSESSENVISSKTGVLPKNKNANFLIDEDSQLMLHDIEIAPSVADAKNYFFYQAADGQLLYMHSVNIRMLQVQWGSLESAPSIICGKILQKESCSMTELLRKRLKYLQHLPVSSQFEVVEIGLDGHSVSNAVFEMFQSELYNRQKNRQRRAKDEKKREKHIDEVNDRQIGKIRERSSNIDVSSSQHFPMYSDWEVSPSSYNDMNSLLCETNTIPTTIENPEQPAETSSSSFARVLTTTEKTERWPTLGLVKSTNAFPELLSRNKNIAAYPFGGISQSSRRNTQLISDSESTNDTSVDAEDDEYAARSPEYRTDYGTAIVNALNQHAILNAVSSKREIGQKHKKKKNTVLFSTNVRSYNDN